MAEAGGEEGEVPVIVDEDDTKDEEDLLYEVSFFLSF